MPTYRISFVVQSADGGRAGQLDFTADDQNGAVKKLSDHFAPLAVDVKAIEQVEA